MVSLRSDVKQRCGNVVPILWQRYKVLTLKNALQRLSKVAWTSFQLIIIIIIIIVIIIIIIIITFILYKESGFSKPYLQY